MREQRRAAHRGSAGLRQTWEGIFARARVRSRYMSLFRRLLTMGMRPAGSTSPSANSIPTSATTSGSIGAAPSTHPVMRGRVVSGPDASAHLASTADRGAMRRSVLMGAPMTEEGSSLNNDSGGDGHPAGVSGRGHGDDHWGKSSVGGSSADIYKLAGQIRRMGGLDRYRIEGLREAKVKGEDYKFVFAVLTLFITSWKPREGRSLPRAAVQERCVLVLLGISFHPLQWKRSTFRGKFFSLW